MSSGGSRFTTGQSPPQQPPQPPPQQQPISNTQYSGPAVDYSMGYARTFQQPSFYNPFVGYYGANQPFGSGAGGFAQPYGGFAQPYGGFAQPYGGFGFGFGAPFGFGLGSLFGQFNPYNPNRPRNQPPNQPPPVRPPSPPVSTPQGPIDNWGAGEQFDTGLVPTGFNWQKYVSTNPDLGQAGIDTEIEAQRHYAKYGRTENRPGDFILSQPAAQTTYVEQTFFNPSQEIRRSIPNPLIMPSQPAAQTQSSYQNTGGGIQGLFDFEPRRMDQMLGLAQAADMRRGISDYQVPQSGGWFTTDDGMRLWNA